jgi:hypothetical protein
VKHLPKFLLGVVCLAACQIDLPVASEIEHMRVLTAFAEVQGDAQRSSPAPGETASVTWAMAYPNHDQDDSELASMFYVCTAPERFSGTPFCQEFIDLAQAGPNAAAAALGGSLGAGDLPDCARDPDRVWDLGPFRLVCVTGTPKLDISIPDSYRASAKLMQGIICRNGTPRFELADQPRLVCDEAREPNAEREEISVYGTVPVQYDADTENHNPRTDAFQLSFGDGPSKVWEASDELLGEDLSDSACEEPALRERVKVSDDHKEAREEEITLGYDASAREDFEGKPEPLTFSVYTTFGSLSARFTVFRSDAETPLERKIKWELSDEEREQLKKSSKYVRFYFTVQDGRGGYAITRRDLCVSR